jgi:EmrB/QacA subfamily drug resistance transporter
VSSAASIAAPTGALRILIPLVVAAGFLMEQLDATIITTAIPDIATSLGDTPLRLNLAITSYVLSLAIFIPISGWIADRFGMRNVICAAFVLFTAGSALCGMATSLPMLVAFRILQGLGGAMMNPVGRLILFRSFPKADLIRAMSYVAVPSMLGPTLGPVLGGFITTYANWRWIFLVNIPFGMIAIVFAWRTVSNVRGAAPSRFDLPGFLLVGVGLVLLQAVLETAGRGEVSWPLETAIVVVGAALLTLYALYARRRASPVLDISLFKIRTFRVGSLAGGLSRIGINVPPFLLPLLFQLGFGMSPLESGSLTFVISIAAVVIRPITAKLLRIFGFRRLLLVNSVLSAGMIASFAWFDQTTPHTVLIAVMMVFGVVRNTQFNSVQLLSYVDIPSPRLSAATSLGSVVQQMTMGLGVSLGAGALAMLGAANGRPTVPEFQHVFLIIALLPLIGIPGFISLRPADGAEVSGRRT